MSPRVQGGIRGGDLQIEAAVHGLGAVTGVVSMTGVGLMLGGGIGFLTPRVGYAAENVLSVELVTATGDVVMASPDENADLFWAVRGSTGNFGVVTALEVKLHEVPPLVHIGLWGWSLDNLEGPVRALREHDWASDGLCLIGLLAPGSLDLLLCHTGPPEAARADLERLRSFGPPATESVPVRAMPFHEASFLFDDLYSPRRGALDEQPVDAFSDAFVDALVAKIREPAGGGERWIEPYRRLPPSNARRRFRAHFARPSWNPAGASAPGASGRTRRRTPHRTNGCRRSATRCAGSAPAMTTGTRPASVWRSTPMRSAACTATVTTACASSSAGGTPTTCSRVPTTSPQPKPEIH